jgi:hypothetical protein
MVKRDDFSPSDVRTLALRAGHLCSNPDCRRPTSGPHSDPTKAVITGEASHIRAAATGGPRYDPSQTPAERKAITNGIWLCGNCNKKVDTDWQAWPASRLGDMKDAHERWIAAEGMIPRQPEITLATLCRLRLHPNVPTITEEVQERLREHELVIRNPNRADLFDFCLEINLPELVYRDGHSQVPIGPTVAVRSIRPPMSASVRGAGASVEMRSPPLTMHYRVDADRLPAGGEFRVAFYTVVPEQTMHYQMCKRYPEDFNDPEDMDTHKECHFYLRGGYKFLLRGEYVPNEYFVPLLFKAAERRIVSYPVQDTKAPWKVWEASLMSGATLRVGGQPKQ